MSSSVELQDALVPFSLPLQAATDAANAADNSKVSVN